MMHSCQCDTREIRKASAKSVTIPNHRRMEAVLNHDGRSFQASSEEKGFKPMLKAIMGQALKKLLWKKMAVRARAVDAR